MRFSISRVSVTLFVILFTGMHAYSQITLTGDDYVSVPAGIVVDIVKVEGVMTVGDLSGVSSANKVRTYKYLDGFGRPLQDIVEGGSPDGKDLIQLYKYDEFGRVTKGYLPFAYTTSSTPYQDRPTAITNQATFYS